MHQNGIQYCLFLKNNHHATKPNKATWKMENINMECVSGVSLIHKAGPGIVLAGKVTMAEPIQLFTQ
jgi:hypothetical protein